MSLSRPISQPVAERIARRLDILAHPGRIRIVDTLDLHEELSVHALADAVGISIFDASQHLSLLRTAGVVHSRRKGRLRCYRVVDPTILGICEQVADRVREQIDDARQELQGDDAHEPD